MSDSAPVPVLPLVSHLRLAPSHRRHAVDHRVAHLRHNEQGNRCCPWWVNRPNKISDSAPGPVLPLVSHLRLAPSHRRHAVDHRVAHLTNDRTRCQTPPPFRCCPLVGHRSAPSRAVAPPSRTRSPRRAPATQQTRQSVLPLVGQPTEQDIRLRPPFRCCPCWVISVSRPRTAITHSITASRTCDRRGHYSLTNPKPPVWR